MNKNLNRLCLLLEIPLVVLLLLACAQAAAPNVPPTPGAVGSLGKRTKTTGCVVQNALPDAACTPGAIIATATTADICKAGYTSQVRDVPSDVKDQVYAEYGVKSHSPGEYEVDHLVSLELGGSNDIANLWPEAAEPRPGFHEKDQVENFLHQQVCSGAMDLNQAQVTEAQNWLTYFKNGAVVAAPAGSGLATPASTNGAAVGGKYAAGARSKKFFYCATDPGLKRVKSKLIWSDDPAVFTGKGLKLHAPCQ